jgi:hypothetical protein
MERLRITNAAECLKRHDWAHRWGQILDTLGLERTAALESRLDRMASLAEAGERSIKGGATSRGRAVVG